MTIAIGKGIGSKIGRVLEVDKRAMQVELAKFLRIRVEVPIDKPLRRGGLLKMKKVKEFGLILGTKDYQIFVISVASLGMMRSIVKLVQLSSGQGGNMVTG